MRWHLAHGERVPRNICASCRRPITPGQQALDLADENCVHLADGYDCLIRHGDRWRRPSAGGDRAVRPRTVGHHPGLALTFADCRPPSCSLMTKSMLTELTRALLAVWRDYQPPDLDLDGSMTEIENGLR
jgi:hypothetical protein